MKKKILEADWLSHPSIHFLSTVFQKSGYEILFVGGCIRNTILKKQVNDVDIATAATPEEIIKICKKNNIKSIPTGIKHGTITIIIDEKTYQITTFRIDEKNYGRHANVKFTDSLELDASRRDLTINALYCNVDGKIIDPLKAFGDLRLGIIRFIGDPNKRILEDHLRILRFFRFYALYGDKKKSLNLAALEACEKHQNKLKKISKERVTLEIKKLLAASNPISTVKKMDKIKILNQIIGNCEIGPFIKYIDFEQKYKIEISWLGRLLSLQNNADYKMILLTKKENRIITKLNEAILLNVDPIEFSYYNGVELGLIYSLLQNSFEKLELNESLINQISSITKNLFPIKTSDLGPKYHGKEIGNKLNELEFKWIKSKFKLSKAQLLRMI